MTEPHEVWELTKLANIGPDAAKLLRAAGVGTADDLRRIGSVEVAARIHSIRPEDPPSRNMLAGLEGAVRGIRWHHISAAERDALWARYQERLQTWNDRDQWILDIEALDRRTAEEEGAPGPDADEAYCERDPLPLGTGSLIGIWIQRIIITLLALVAVAFACGAGLQWYLDSTNGRDHVPDAVLIRNLQTHRADFERLIAMFRKDRPVSVVDTDWVSPEDAITYDRWSEYKRLFSKLDLDGGMRGWDGDSIWFISTAQGLVTGGSIKGYMYQPEDPKPLYWSLDSVPDDLESNVRGYRKIDDEWYIVFTWDD